MRRYLSPRASSIQVGRAREDTSRPDLMTVVVERDHVLTLFAIYDTELRIDT